MLFFFCVFCGGGVLKCGGMLAVLMSFAWSRPSRGPLFCTTTLSSNGGLVPCPRTHLFSISAEFQLWSCVKVRVWSSF